MQSFIDRSFDAWQHIPDYIPDLAAEQEAMRKRVWQARRKILGIRVEPGNLPVTVVDINEI